MSEHLLPCPFCGGTNVAAVSAADDYGTFDWKVYCGDCDAFHETEAVAIAAWNHRAVPQESKTPITRALVEVMEFRLQIGPFGIPDVVHYIRSIAEMEIAVLFGNSGSVEVILCGTYRQYDNDIVAVSLPTITTMERLRMLVTVLSTE